MIFFLKHLPHACQRKLGVFNPPATFKKKSLYCKTIDLHATIGPLKCQSQSNALSEILCALQNSTKYGSRVHCLPQAIFDLAFRACAMYLSTLHIMGNDLGQPDKASVLSPSCLICLGIDFHEHITFKLGKNLLTAYGQWKYKKKGNVRHGNKSEYQA